MQNDMENSVLWGLVYPLFHAIIFSSRGFCQPGPSLAFDAYRIRVLYLRLVCLVLNDVIHKRNIHIKLIKTHKSHSKSIAAHFYSITVFFCAPD